MGPTGAHPENGRDKRGEAWTSICLTPCPTFACAGGTNPKNPVPRVASAYPPDRRMPARATNSRLRWERRAAAVLACVCVAWLALLAVVEATATGEEEAEAEERVGLERPGNHTLPPPEPLSRFEEFAFAVNAATLVCLGILLVAACAVTCKDGPVAWVAAALRRRCCCCCCCCCSSSSGGRAGVLSSRPDAVAAEVPLVGGWVLAGDSDDEDTSPPPYPPVGSSSQPCGNHCMVPPPAAATAALAGHPAGRTLDPPLFACVAPPQAAAGQAPSPAPPLLLLPPLPPASSSKPHRDLGLSCTVVEDGGEEAMRMVGLDAGWGRRKAEEAEEAKGMGALAVVVAAQNRSSFDEAYAKALDRYSDSRDEGP